MTAQSSPPAAGIKITDIFFILFRHKRKVIALSILTLVALGLFLFIKRPPYVSTAKLLLRYVVETKEVDPVSGDTQIKSTDARGENIISSEIEIIRSLDLARQVATTVGPARILAHSGGGDDPIEAASLIFKGLSADAGRRGNVISVQFRHPDSAVVQTVLEELIKAYFNRHAEIHRPSGISDDYISQQAASLRARLAQTEESLRRRKQEIGVINLQEAKIAYAQEINTLRQALFTVEAELAQKKAGLAELEKLSPAKIASEAAELGIPAEKISEYKRLGARLELLRKRELEMSAEMTPDHPILKNVQTQLSEAENIKVKLEEEYPKLVNLSIPGAGAMDKSIDRTAEAMLISSLNARIRTINEQISKIKDEASRLEVAESAINDLERQKALEETNYRAYAVRLEQSRIDSLSANKVQNINPIQMPTPPMRDIGNLKKPLIMILMLGLGLAFGLPFLIEMVLDTSIKRPIEMETRLRAPHLISVPYLNGALSGRSKTRKFFSRSRGGVPKDSPTGMQASPSASEQPVDPNTPVSASAPQIAPWDSSHNLHNYFEVIRDNLIHYFEVNQMLHKPKLVAITSCGHGAGVSTLAAGLAASLSETGDGNVLLVDMNLEQGAAHPFYKGKPDCALVDALEADKRESALVQSNLYMVRADQPHDKLQRALPLRFNNLIPKLKASDYDYIIFDMPAATPASITQRLASYMDSVLLVVEAEKTSADRARRVSDQFLQNNVKVKTVLNKTRQYGPEWLNEG